MSDRETFDTGPGVTGADTPVGNASVKKRHIFRNLSIAVGLVLVLVGLACAAGYAKLSAEYDRVERIDTFNVALERPAPPVVEAGQKAPLNILLLGSDSRNPDDSDVAADEMRGFRSDTLMVLQVSPDREHVTIMSIMRDTWVSIQGVGDAKINAAVAYGGVPLAVNTVEQFIDAQIDHVVLIDFESFIGLTDALGGVTVENPIAFTSTHGGFEFAEGSVTMNGAEALGFVRERYSFADGDFQRVRNQQLFLEALIAVLVSRDTLTSPAKITGTFDALAPYVVVDRGLDLNAAIGLGIELSSIRTEHLKFFTSPTLGTGTSDDGQSIVLPDWGELEQVRAAVREGTLDEYAAALEPVPASELGW